MILAQNWLQHMIIYLAYIYSCDRIIHLPLVVADSASSFYDTKINKKIIHHNQLRKKRKKVEWSRFDMKVY
jgi:hypothetical protein